MKVIDERRENGGCLSLTHYYCIYFESEYELEDQNRNGAKVQLLGISNFYAEYSQSWVCEIVNIVSIIIIIIVVTR